MRSLALAFPPYDRMPRVPQSARAMWACVVSKSSGIGPVAFAVPATYSASRYSKPVGSSTRARCGSPVTGFLIGSAAPSIRPGTRTRAVPAFSSIFRSMALNCGGCAFTSVVLNTWVISEPGSLITQVFSTTITTGLPTQFKPIELAIDEKAGTARVRVPGLVDTKAEPIKNPVTGESHRVRVHLPTGFEYREAEYVAGTAKATGAIPLDFSTTHAHIAKADWGTRGILS